MDFELDPLDIVSDNAAKNARPSGKFRPKAKLKPRKESSTPVQSTRCTQAIIVSENESKKALENGVDGIVLVPPPDNNRSYGLTLPTEHLLHKEKGDIGSLLEVSDGFTSQNTILIETHATLADMSRNDEVILGTARETHVDPGLQLCNTSSFHLAPELPVSLDPLTHEEFTYNTAEDFQVESKMFEVEEGNTSPCLETHVDSDEGSLLTNVSATDRGRGTTYTGLDHSVNHQQPSTSGQGDEHSRSLRRCGKRKHFNQLVDDLEEEDLETCQFRAEYPRGSSVNEDDHSDKEYDMEDERQNKKLSGKSMKPVRKHEKANEVSVQLTKKPSKKFSHSTRRRGRFEKGWLKTPEDEIEISDLSLKEIIVLGEYRELTAKKNPEASQAPVMTQSTAKSSSRYYEDDDVFASEQGHESDDEQEKVAVQDDGTSFNYHTNMKKISRGRWTNQDTELFYEALQQFGTDLTMIAQLFPGRTRDHIKLKYKNEERKHPMRLHDALSNRAKGHSHFEVIINQVQKAVAKRRQNFDRDDLDGLSEEDRNKVPPETNEAPKYEQVEQSEDDVPKATGPVESSESEDDEERWSQFRSDL